MSETEGTTSTGVSWTTGTDSDTSSSVGGGGSGSGTWLTEADSDASGSGGGGVGELDTCGDGIIDDGEECDPGAEDSINCDANCSIPSCGDTYTNEAAGEECDDGNFDDGDGCASDCTRESRVVFVSSVAHQGDLGGLDGADATCQALAEAADLAGVYMAWLSYAEGTASERLQLPADFAATFTLIDGENVVATGLEDLLDGTLDHPINRDEFGAEVNASVWTGTDESGESQDPEFGVFCEAWTSTNSRATALVGVSSKSTAAWTNHSLSKCSDAAHLYCVQVE